MGICGEHNFYPPFLPPPPPPGFWVNPARLGRRQERSRKRKKVTTDASSPFPFFFVLFFPLLHAKGKVESIRGLSRCHITSRARNLQIGGKERKRKIFAFTGKRRSLPISPFFPPLPLSLTRDLSAGGHLEEKREREGDPCSPLPKSAAVWAQEGRRERNKKMSSFRPIFMSRFIPSFFPWEQGREASARERSGGDRSQPISQGGRRRRA